jgi:hypothetical protein
LNLNADLFLAIQLAGYILIGTGGAAFILGLIMTIINVVSK